ncbi:hypothetical protein PBI_MIMI_297 [Arthrobacter phage Mimi]|nr:hypothetical protein PBI_MIMI_91 [Arthrobacter phage Mimi]
MTSNVTIEDRYRSALTEVRMNSDVLVFDNYPSCCGSCAGSEIEHENPDADYVYFINTQGRGLMFKDGEPYHFEDPEDMEPERPATNVYFSHSTLKAAGILRDAFVKFGLTVEWNGSDVKCVTLKF